MSYGLHICKTYKVEYSDKVPVSSYGDCDEFVSWVKEVGDDSNGDYWLSEDEGYMELGREFLEGHLEDEKFGEVCKTILEEMDKDNDFAEIHFF